MVKHIICAVDESEDSYYAASYVPRCGLWQPQDIVTLLNCGKDEGPTLKTLSDLKISGLSGKSLEEHQYSCESHCRVFLEAGASPDRIRIVHLKGDPRET
eukprot:Sdes_comp15709_c1_seq1m4742